MILMKFLRNLSRDFPGIGASILIPLVASASAISSDKFNILLTFTPLCGSISYLVTAGPFWTFLISAFLSKSLSIEEPQEISNIIKKEPDVEFAEEVCEEPII